MWGLVECWKVGWWYHKQPSKWTSRCQKPWVQVFWMSCSPRPGIGKERLLRQRKWQKKQKVQGKGILSVPAGTWEHCDSNLIPVEQAHLPGQALIREIHKRHHLVVLKNMCHSWHRGKQNSVDKWSKMKQGKHSGNEQGAGIEINVPSCQVSVCSRVVGDPCMQLIQSFIKQEPRPVDQERDNKVDPSPSPVQC